MTATVNGQVDVSTPVLHSLAIKGPRPWVDVTAYGADPTGVADSSTAFQAAIDAVAGGGRVYVPTGRYRIATTLLLFHHHSITIEGESSGIIATPGTPGTFLGGGSVLLNYTGGVMVEVRHDYETNQPHTNHTVFRDLTFEAQNNATDINVYLYAANAEVTGTTYFDHCEFVRGLKSVSMLDFFDVRFSGCNFNGQPASGTGFGGNQAVYLSGASDMINFDHCFWTTWENNIAVNPANAGAGPSHPARLWFRACKLESTNKTNCDLQNVSSAYFLNCHFEASAQSAVATYYDIHFGNIAGGDSEGMLTLEGCDFAAGAYAQTLVKCGPKFASLVMRSCWTSTTSTTATVVVDNSSVTGYGNHSMGSVLIENCALHSGVTHSAFDGNYEVRGGWQPADGLLLAAPYPPLVEQVNAHYTLTTSFADLAPVSAWPSLGPGKWQVTAVFAFLHSGAGDTVGTVNLFGQIVTSGGAATISNSTADAWFVPMVAGAQAMVSQTWLITVTQTTSVKMQAKKDAGTGASTVRASRSTITCVKVG